MTTATRTVPDPYGRDGDPPIDVSDLPLPIPTDHDQLYAYFIEHRPWHGNLHAALAAEVGIDRATTLVDKVVSSAHGDDLIVEGRTSLRDDIGRAHQALRCVRQSLDNLRGDAIYDIEYAEGGAVIAAMSAQIDLALQAVTIVEAINPFRRPEPVSSRREILSRARIHPPQKRGFVDVAHDIDMAALAALVADGLGEFGRDLQSPAVVKPITGVILNEAGYHAALAADAEVPF